MAEKRAMSRLPGARERISGNGTRRAYAKALGVAFVVVMLGLICEPLLAQESPGDSENSATLAETIEWLRSTMNNQELLGEDGEICRRSVLGFRDGYYDINRLAHEQSRMEMVRRPLTIFIPCRWRPWIP